MYPYCIYLLIFVVLAQVTQSYPGHGSNPNALEILLPRNNPYSAEHLTKHIFKRTSGGSRRPPIPPRRPSLTPSRSSSITSQSSGGSRPGSPQSSPRRGPQIGNPMNIPTSPVTPAPKRDLSPPGERTPFSSRQSIGLSRMTLSDHRPTRHTSRPGVQRVPGSEQRSMPPMGSLAPPVSPFSPLGRDSSRAESPKRSGSSGQRLSVELSAPSVGASPFAMPPEMSWQNSLSAGAAPTEGRGKKRGREDSLGPSMSAESVEQQPRKQLKRLDAMKSGDWKGTGYSRPGSRAASGNMQE